MKSVNLFNALIVVLILLSGTAVSGQPSQIRTYEVVVNARDKISGVLEKVTGDKVFITTKRNQYLAINSYEIKSIKIKKYPKRKRPVKLLQPQPGASAYDQNGFLTKEYLDQENTLGEKVVISGFTILLRAMYGSIYNKFGSLAVFQIDKDSSKFRSNVQDLSNYAAYNQIMNEYDAKDLKLK